MTAPAIEGGELVKRLRDYDDGRSVDQIDLQADIALRLMDEAAAFIEQSSTLLADAKRERDAALAEIVGLKRVVDLADVALRAMVDEFGGIHDQEGCPEDDTCDCPEAMKLNAAFAAIFKAQHTPSPASGVDSRAYDALPQSGELRAQPKESE